MTTAPALSATDAELTARGTATLLSAWEAYARGCAGAACTAADAWAGRHSARASSRASTRTVSST